MAETETETGQESKVKDSKDAPKKCACGKTKDPEGNCDGSHVDKESEQLEEKNKKAKAEQDKIEAEAQAEKDKAEKLRIENEKKLADEKEKSEKAKTADIQEKKRVLSDSNLKAKTGDKILIRCISTKAGVEKTKNMFHTVANNKILMKNSGFTISDPNYDEKMYCVRENLPFPLPEKLALAYKESLKTK